MKIKKMVGSRKQEKERVRGPRLGILVKRFRTVPFVEALRRADNENRVIASNARLDKVLVGSDEWKNILDIFVCWSGTMTGYEKPGEKFGKSVLYTDLETKQRYVFPVPEEYKGAKDAILAVEHPDYTLEKDGKDLVVAVQNIGNISLIERFPSECGWYLKDEKHVIPTRNKVSSSKDDARHLWRIEDGSRVGPVARGVSGLLNSYNDRRDLGLTYTSYSLGVAVEAPDTSDKKSDGK